MKKLPFMLLSSSLLLSVPAFAEDTTEKDTGILEERVAELEQRVSDLEEQIAALLAMLNNDSEETTGSIGSDQQEVPEGLIGYNEEVEIGDWIATMTGYSFEDEFRDSDDSYIYFSAGDGSKYLLVDMVVTNLGTQADTFIENWYATDTDIEAVMYYMDKYEFNTANLMGTKDRDLCGASIKPLEEHTGCVIFKVSDAVVDSDGSLVMELTLGDNTYTFQIR